ncbi:MAG: hypothetical protein CEO12_347 [Parcubacteria group bacterium Gr01-1014_46]|nr:MAG: hypothetical protein CEO12_347 [Parcubacteria group bacterium Gr01-1014_46]
MTRQDFNLLHYIVVNCRIRKGLGVLAHTVPFHRDLLVGNVAQTIPPTDLIDFGPNPKINSRFVFVSGL